MNKKKKEPVKSNRKTKKRKSSRLSKKSYFSALSSLIHENQNRSFSIKQLHRSLKLHSRIEKARMVENLEKMVSSGEVSLTPEGYYHSNQSAGIYEGKVDFVNPRFAFIISDELEDDVWVSSDDMAFALDGDRVKFKLFAKKSKKPEGQVLEVLERGRDEFVGKIELSERYAFVVSDNRKMHLDIFVPPQSILKAQHGDKVIVKITQWHDAQNSPVGEVIKVLGKAGTHDAEMHAILAEFGLPTDFPEEVLNESSRVRSQVTPSEIKQRRDFRNITTFTIDPADAKDFDDALSIQTLDNGNWEIGVHIADVTHYVRPGSALEKEAFKRATSVYLVDRVVPMLPEKLSNNLCSLRPREDRLTFSAVFEINENAQVLKKWFGRTVIHSDHRFSYEEAQKGIDSGEGPYASQLKTLNTLAKKFTKARFKAGAMNFETPEVRFILDEKGKPTGLYTKERKDAHRLIEEFMLLANKYVAEFVYHMKEKDKASSEKTMVYRIHEEPNTEKLQNFSAFARKFGHNVATEGKAISQSLNKMIASSSGSPQQDVLQYLAIRTMAKARYSTEAIGHFGLAFQHYTHFTSPIRRYPDMMVHRLLQRYLDHKKSVDRGEFEAMCKHSTEREKMAADAERASIKYKQVEYMQYQEDQVYEGVITGVTDWGVYVEINSTKCEGMVRLGDITDDFYELDAENYRLVGKKYKRFLMFGDPVKVRVKDTNLEKRTMDFLLVN